MLEAIVAIVTLLIGAVWYGGQRAKDKQRREQRERNFEAHERARKAKHEVDGLSRDAVRDRLRERAGR